MFYIRIVLFIFILSLPYVARADVPVSASSADTISKSDSIIKTGTGRYHFSYESVSMPLGDTMGLSGFDYLIDINPYWSVGLGIYGSLAGNYGGFFTGGMENEIHLKITDRLDYSAGLFFGGGGGASNAGQGGGLMLRPHTGLIYDMGSYQMGVEYSWIKFPNGSIDSSQIALNIGVPFEVIYAGRDHVGDFDVRKLDDMDRKGGLVRQYMVVIGESYTPYPGILKSKGVMLPQGKFDVVGFELGNYINDNVFGYLEAAGAAGGGSDGYAEVFIGGGYHYPLVGDKLYVLLKGAVGEAGGGFVPTGGGFVYKLYGGLEYYLYPDLFIRGYGGYINAPSGTFAGNIFAINIGYLIETASFDTYAKSFDLSEQDYFLKGWRIRGSTQAYYDGDILKKTGTVHQNPIELFCLKADSMLSDNWYLSGQAMAAYAGGDGGGVGGYAVGLVGIGYQTPMFYDRCRLYVELLAGAAGGGGLAVGGGAIVQPMAGISYRLNDSMDIQIEGGMVSATATPFQANVVGIGLVYQFGTINHSIK